MAHASNCIMIIYLYYYFIVLYAIFKKFECAAHDSLIHLIINNTLEVSGSNGYESKN